MMSIYAHARTFMAEHGNPRQWGATNWPPRPLVEEDICLGRSYVCTEGENILGVFCFLHGEAVDPCYNEIDGEWPGHGPYGVVHRIASSGEKKGVGTKCITWAHDQCGDLRMDTHGDNLPMQSLLRKLGFQYCGIIHVEEDDDPRLAFEWL